METRWRETLDPKNGGGTVQVKIGLIYSDDKKRPDFFIVNQTINGEGSIKRLKNTPTGK